ncbi:hypothetical protein HPB52_012458 [Rhipicephalus sanguineus]|uniref:Uncharacterized protein n=1 Tax=Rhipicephalus sanguineus TaxID=34632 RepID=A0A9D4TA08_RHISA|nr:hypothetical protein HPB52_012458 [Rhipicephalus sanguineus]
MRCPNATQKTTKRRRKRASTRTRIGVFTHLEDASLHVPREKKEEKEQATSTDQTEPEAGAEKTRWPGRTSAFGRPTSVGGTWSSVNARGTSQRHVFGPGAQRTQRNLRHPAWLLSYKTRNAATTPSQGP